MPKDLRTAAWLYEQAAEQGYVPAFYQLGRCFQYGLGRELDPEQAFHCYLTAAEVGFERAQMKAGFCFETGFGTKKDEQQEFFWYQAAALQHFAPGETELGRCYEFGKGVEADPQVAVSWYRKAAEQGYADAECCYGVCLEQGNGVEKDVKEAVSWYQKAALHGHATGMNNLGVCYERGDGVEKDEKAALMWYERAADRGSSYGCRTQPDFIRMGRSFLRMKKAAEYLERCAGWGRVMPWSVSAGFMSWQRRRRILKRHWTFIRLQQEKAIRLACALWVWHSGMAWVSGKMAKAGTGLKKQQKKEMFSDITVAFCCLTGIAGSRIQSWRSPILKNRRHAANM